MKQPETITIDSTKYIRADSIETQPPSDSPIRIVILQRGWVMVGRYGREGDQAWLDNAHVIRIWGTTKGLGQLALGGPTSSTVLDPAGRVDFHVLGEVATLACKEDKWNLFG